MTYIVWCRRVPTGLGSPPGPFGSPAAPTVTLTPRSILTAGLLVACFVLVALPGRAAADLTGSAATPLSLMEDFLVLREKALDRAALDDANLLSMEQRLDKLAHSGPDGASPELQVMLFIQKGYAFLARKGGQIAQRARERARELLSEARPGPHNCTYLDSGGIKVIFRGDPKRKEIALTYDDGPIEGNQADRGTRQLLRILAEYNAKATFFMVGQNAKAYPHLVQMVKRAGHSIANHTRTHAQLTKLSVAGMRDQVATSKEMISTAMGGGPMPLFRLPYGAGVHTERVNKVVGESHPFNIFWTIDSNDWRRPGEQALVNSVLESRMLNGAIVLFHDHAPNTTFATRRILQELVPRGYRFITVDEMLGIDRQTAFLEAFSEAAGAAEAGRDQSAYEGFIRLASNAPSVVLAQEALDFAYLCARMSLGPKAVHAARLLLARTISPTGELTTAPEPAPSIVPGVAPILPSFDNTPIVGAGPLPTQVAPLSGPAVGPQIPAGAAPSRAPEPVAPAPKPARR